MRRVYWNGFCNERRKRSARPSLTYEYFEMPTAIQNVYGFIIIKVFQTCVLKQRSCRSEILDPFHTPIVTELSDATTLTIQNWNGVKKMLFLFFYILQNKNLYNYFPFIKLQSVVIDLMKKRTKTSTFQAYK